MSTEIKAGSRLRASAPVEASLPGNLKTALQTMIEGEARLLVGDADEASAAGAFKHDPNAPGITLTQQKIQKLAAFFKNHPFGVISLSGEGNGRIGFEWSAD